MLKSYYINVTPPLLYSGTLFMNKKETSTIQLGKTIISQQKPTNMKSMFNWGNFE